MRRLTHAIVLAAFIFSCGGQWYVLQGVAWIKMLHDYAQVVPFARAVSMTFSGEYPCAICKAIAEKKQSENDKACSPEKFEKKFLPPMTIGLAPRSVAAFCYPNIRNDVPTRPEAPPTPPPRPAVS